MKLLIHKSTTIVMLWFLLFSVSSTAQVDNIDYATQSAGIRCLQNLNDRLHTLIHNDSHNDVGFYKDMKSIYSPDFTCQLSCFEKEPDTEGTLSFDAQGLEQLMVDEFKPATPLHPPFLFNGLEFSKIYAENDRFYIDIAGVLGLAGEFYRGETNRLLPFSCKLRLGTDSDASSCDITALDIGSEIRFIQPDFDAEPWKNHNEVFFNPMSSPLLEEKVTKYDELELLFKPIKGLEVMRKWEVNSIADKTEQEAIDLVYLEQLDASIATAELCYSLPHIVPNTPQYNTRNEHNYDGEDQIIELVNRLRRDPPTVRTAVTNVIANSETNQTRIQAQLIRAWQGISSDDVNTIVLNDISKSKQYPASFLPKLAMFYARTMKGQYRIAIAEFDSLSYFGPNTVLIDYLAKNSGEPWFQYAQDMDKQHTHIESLRGYFIASMITPTPERLERLQEKAMKMGEYELAEAMIWKRMVLGNDMDANYWLELSEARASQGDDPHVFLERAAFLGASESDPRFVVAPAKHTYLQGDLIQAQTMVINGLGENKKSPKLLQLRADMTDNDYSHRKALSRLNRITADSNAVRVFNKGLVRQLVADSAKGGMSEDRNHSLYRDAIFEYQRAYALGYKSPLVYRKIAECYLSLQNLDETAYYLDKAMDEGELNAKVYFAHAVISLASGDMDGLRKSMRETERLGLKDRLAEEEEQSLFYFMQTLLNVEKYLNLSTKKPKKNESIPFDEIKVIGEEIEEQMEWLKQASHPSSDAYYRLCYVMKLSIDRYNDPNNRAKKKYRDANITPAGIIDALNEHSLIEPHFFKINPIMKPICRLNDMFKEEIYQALERPPFRATVKYLEDKNVFKDPYNYL